MLSLTDEQLANIKALIFREGRLLERQLYRYFFEEGSCEACLKALLAYQNADGGFGNGLEPDLLCPGSSAIGAETALFVLDMLDDQESEIILPLLDCLEQNQTAQGGMQHPPKDFERYPHQPWWSGDDTNRVLVLAAQLHPWQEAQPTFFARAWEYYQQMPEPDAITFYSYPQFAYLSAHQQLPQDQQSFHQLCGQLPGVLQAHADHFPLFSRYWYYAQDYVNTDTVNAAATTVLSAFKPDGSLPNPYPDLPWWRPIFTLDALMLLKKGQYL
ncbi:MAG: hypothetical protein ACFBSG_14485 [Leptolyngbyaceae cyanobacterium]